MAAKQEINLTPRLPLLRVKVAEVTALTTVVRPETTDIRGSSRFRNRHGRISRRRILFPFLYRNEGQQSLRDKKTTEVK